MKIYRQVPVTERLPEKEGKIFVEDGEVMFLGGKFWELGYASEQSYPDFWLEEFELPTEEEIRKAWEEQVEFWQAGQNFLDGANYILNLIKNK